MKKSILSRFSTTRYRAKRRLGSVLLDMLKALLMVCVILVASALMIYAYNFGIMIPYFGIRETVVRGCNELTEKDILILADVKPTYNLMAVNEEAISARVKLNPWVKNVYIGRELPDRLVIEVRERKAIAVIKMGQELFLLDGEGVAFKKRDAIDSVDLPILTGFYKDGAIDKNLMQRSLILLEHLEKKSDFPNLNAVSEIHGDRMLGFSIFTNTGLCLQVGFDCYESKFKRLIPVLADLERKNLKSVYLNIDLSDPAKITVKRSTILSPQGPVNPEDEANKYHI
jgi:cell division protein FtsQ